ncbi:unnamed protein product [Caenorhabditis bovis]|uniref:Rho-GAP domain-containing protein n=1 Tax=Caenorhabditis bovis TaxID=2654633 RepID=A0A8S1EHK0_9PELO|nr:unnamed protein product [Caenorhabditis bovis]
MSRSKPTLAADHRKNAEHEKKLGILIQQKDKLQKRSEFLNTELNTVKNELNMTIQERGRMQQFWNVAEIHGENEKNRAINTEKIMFEIKTKQAEQVQKLQQKIRSLVLNAKTHRHASTQSDPIPPTGSLINSDSQTVDGLTNEKANSLLRQSDDLLMAFVSELEKEKLNAQSDLKYAIVQLEQRMKEEMECQMKNMREERELEMEEIGLKHIEQLRSLESQHSEELARLHGRIEFLQKESATLRDIREALTVNLESSKLKLVDQAAEMGALQAEIEEAKKELMELRTYKESFQRDIRNVELMKKEAEKYKELNEIIIEEFGKIEQERDDLLEELERHLGRINLENRKKYNNIQKFDIKGLLKK